MNTLLVFTVLFAGACVADVSHIVDHKPQIAILEDFQDASPDGSFRYGYKTENGISAQAEGSPSGEVQGSYSYPGEDGKLVKVDWIAGVNGFNAQGDSVPAVPASVVRTLEYNAAHPYKEPVRP